MADLNGDSYRRESSRRTLKRMANGWLVIGTLGAALGVLRRDWRLLVLFVAILAFWALSRRYD